MYIYNQIRSDFFKQYLYISLIYFILSTLMIKINFATLMDYQDQYFYINESIRLLSSDDFISVVINFLFIPSNFEFNNWTFIHYLNGYLFQDIKAILFFNFLFHYFVVIYTWKTFKYFFKSINVEFLFFIFLLFSFPLLFIDALYLKESLFLLIFVALKNRNLFLIIISSFFLIKIRFSHFILFVFISLFFRFFFSVRKKLKILILLISLALGIITYSYMSTLSNTGIKLIDYMNQSTEENSISKVKNLENFSLKFIDKENLLSLKNIIVIPALGLLSPPPVRFLKAQDLRTIIESVMVSIWWWIGLPFFFIFILDILKKDFKLASYAIGIFLSIFLASSFSLVTIAPEIFRYRLPIYGIFLFGMFFGLYIYKVNKQKFYSKIIKFWFCISSSLYLLA